MGFLRSKRGVSKGGNGMTGCQVVGLLSEEVGTSGQRWWALEGEEGSPGQ